MPQTGILWEHISLEFKEHTPGSFKKIVHKDQIQQLF